MSNGKITPLMPTYRPEQTTVDQDWTDYFRYLAGEINWEPRFAKFQPKRQPDSLEAYMMTNGL